MAEVRHFLKGVVIDEVSLAPATPDQEQERKVAVNDLLESNYFEPEGGPGGPYDLRIGLVEMRLDLEITADGFATRHLLSLAPFRRIVRDYLTICQSYYEATRNATAAHIEAIDMGRREVATSVVTLPSRRSRSRAAPSLCRPRRLFTLLCALHWRG